RLKDRVEREKLLGKLEQELKPLVAGAIVPEDLAELLFAKGERDKMVGQLIGDSLICMLVPYIRGLQNAHDQSEQVQRNLHVAFALGVFHRDYGRYPAKLDELAPKYLAAVPDDIFSGSSLIFHSKKDSYLLYSVGVNGKDDGGRCYSDDPPGDDLGVR